MEFARRFLDSKRWVRQQVVFTAMFVRDSVSGFYTTATTARTTSINDDQVHKPPSVETRVSVANEAPRDEVEETASRDGTTLAVETKALNGGLTCHTIKAQDVTDPTTFMESLDRKLFPSYSNQRPRCTLV